jgi:hypothetical protein
MKTYTQMNRFERLLLWLEDRNLYWLMRAEALSENAEYWSVRPYKIKFDVAHAVFVCYAYPPVSRPMLGRVACEGSTRKDALVQAIRFAEKENRGTTCTSPYNYSWD